MGAQILKLGLPVLEKALFQGSASALRGRVEVGRSFGAVLQGTLAGDGSKKIDLASVSADILAMLQSGMPFSVAVNQVSQKLADKIASALVSGTQHSIDSISKNKLVQAFASALAPPGAAPPGSSAEIAATLAQRLQTLVANLAGETQANVGQQNRFSGQILDADPAKEIPAQQQSGQPASAGAAVLSFVDSILKDVLQQLAVPSGQFATAPPAGATPLLTPHLQHLAGFGGPLLTPHDSSVNRAATAPQPGDVLGRIIARAVISDARTNAGSHAAAAAPSAPQSAQQAQRPPATTPADVRAALDTLVAAVTAAGKDAGGAATSNQNGNAFSGAFGQRLAAQLTATHQTPVSDAGTFASQANALLGSWNAAGGATGTQGPGQPSLSPYTTVDANAVIDQVVKGFVVRSFGENNSEVRMRLSPEHLGDVSLKLSVVGGTISASITAQNADVRDTLLANQSQLSKSLADAGLKLANFSVDVSGGGANGSSQQQHLAQHAGVRRIGFAHTGSTGEDDLQPDALAATPNFGPPLLVGQNKGLFNYLA